MAALAAFRKSTSPRSSSPTTRRRRSKSPTASSSWTRAASSRSARPARSTTIPRPPSCTASSANRSCCRSRCAAARCSSTAGRSTSPPTARASGASKLFVRRHDMQIGPAGTGALEGAVRHVRTFGPIQRAEVALSGGEGKTVIEIDAPRDRELQPGDTVGLQPRRYRIFAAQDLRHSGAIASRIRHLRLRVRFAPQNGTKSPFTIQPLLVCNNGRSPGDVMRAILAIFALLALAGCMADTPRSSRPCMSAWPMAAPARPAGRRVHDLAVPPEQRPRHRALSIPI